MLFMLAASTQCNDLWGGIPSDVSHKLSTHAIARLCKEALDNSPLLFFDRNRNARNLAARLRPKAQVRKLPAFGLRGMEIDDKFEVGTT